MKQTGESVTQSIPNDFLVPSQVTVGEQTYDLGLKVDLARLVPLLANQASSEPSTQNDPLIEVVLKEFIDAHEKEETRFYKVYLPKSVPKLGLRPKPSDILAFRKSLMCKAGGKNAYLRALKSFYNWLYSPESGYDFKPSENPTIGIKALKVPKRIMPAQSKESIQKLLSLVLPPSGTPLSGMYLRNTLLVALFINSGGRLSEVTGICEEDILWSAHKIRTIAKGDKEVYMPIGDDETETLLKAWIAELQPSTGETIWDIKKSGIVSFFRRLEKKAGFKANPHSFRRGFASILREMGFDRLTIQSFGHWDSGRMVDKYTESVTYDNVQEHYQAPISIASFQSAALPTELPRHKSYCSCCQYECQATVCCFAAQIDRGWWGEEGG